MIKEITDKELNCFDIDKTDNPFINYLGYYIDNVVLGYLSYNLIYDKIEIVNIFVKEEYRNNKIASYLMEYLINIAKKRNIINITLEVNVNNIYAIKLYKKYGFKKVALRKGYYKGIDGILMEMII